MKQFLLFILLMFVFFLNYAQNTYPLKSIAEMTTNNPDGSPAALNQSCELRGVVYGVNLRTGGLQFVIIDSTNNGVTVFRANENFAYTVKEGDRVAVQGKIGFFNGLTELIVEQNIQVLSTENTLFAPTVVTALNETTESQLVKIENVTLSNPTQWTNSGSAFNVDVTNGTATFQLRIINATNIFGTAAPTGTFSIVGLGGQFDNSVPYDGGYQLFPRYLADFQGAITGGVIGYPTRSIGQMTTNNSVGKADSLGKRCALEGVVYGVNLSNTGLQFTLIDAQNEGIAVFKGGDSLGYTVKEGDNIQVKGTINQFRGLTQIEIDSLIVLSSNNVLVEPTLVTTLNETTESQLVSFQSTAVLNDATQWTNIGAGFNVEISTSFGNFVMRIDDQTDLFGGNPPVGEFIVTGLGGQFDAAEPLTEGYQIIPRYKEDLTILLGSKQLNLAQWIQFYPNPTTDLLFIHTDMTLKNIQIFDLEGKKVLETIGTTNTINVSALTAGVYAIGFQTQEGTWSSRFVKQ